MAIVQLCTKNTYICTQLPRARPFQLTVLLKTKQKTTKKACQALRQGTSCSLLGLRSSREGTFPKKTQTHHQSKIFLTRNPLPCSGNPASLQQNTQRHWQPEGVSEATACRARDAIVPMVLGESLKPPWPPSWGYGFWLDRSS